ncbi:hypothetical protein [Bdellovibrio sp. GT3]|uniref:hypothetical protein n=1 Tax=Bdellovibrio sp. GT3 TaxID=3136282 RepID=UPI0030EFCD16
MKKMILASLFTTLAASSAFAGSRLSSYNDSLRKIHAALTDASVISAINGEAVKKVEVGGDDNLDVQITSDSCQTIVGLTYVLSNDVIVGYKVENIAACQ